MRREKRLAENEERYRAEQDRRRAKRNRDSLPVAPAMNGGDGPTIGEAGEPRYGTQIVGFLSASER
jgi:hypothetical protein